MQLKTLAVIALLASVPQPALAGICLLSLPTGGSLAMSADGLRLGSEEGTLPIAGTLTVASVGPSTLTVDPPIWAHTGTGYHSAGEVREVRYSAPVANGTRGYSSGASSITIPNLVNAIVMTINTRVTNSAGFAAGDYTLKTVITCS